MYCTAEGPRREPRLTDFDKLNLRMCSEYQFYATTPEDARRFGVYEVDSASRWLATGEFQRGGSFVSLAGPRVLRGFPRYPKGGAVWGIERFRNRDHVKGGFAYQVAVCQRPLEICAARLPNWLAMEWVACYRHQFIGSNPSAYESRLRNYFDGVWQPELISLFGPAVLEGGAA